MIQLKPLPADRELEKDVISTLINFPETIFTANGIINREDFTNAICRQLFDTIERLVITNKPCDIITISAELRQKELFNDNFNEVNIVELSDRSYSKAYIDNHCKILKDLSIRRKLILMSDSIQLKSYDNTNDLLDVLEYAQKEIFINTSEEVKSEPEHIGDLTVNVANEIEYKQTNPNKIGIPSGFSGLKWYDSDLIIGAGRPAMGKTYVGAIKFALESAMYDYPTLIFSLEMSKSQITQRFISLQTGISSDKIRDAKIYGDDWQKIEKAQTYFQNLPLYIDDNAGMTIWQLQAKARKMKMKHNIKIIFVDYLQLISAHQKGINRDQEMGIISRTLKKIAKDLNIPVIALSQLNRGVESRSDKRPLISDLRESGNIEQDADRVLMFYRPFYYSKSEHDAGIGEIIEVKNRSGALNTYNFYHKADWSEISSSRIMQDMSLFKVDDNTNIKANTEFEETPF